MGDGLWAHVAGESTDHPKTHIPLPGAAAVPAGSCVAVQPFSLRQHSSVCLGVVWLQSCPLTAGTSTGSSRLFSFLLSAGEPGWPCWEPACPGWRLCPHLRALLPSQLPSRCSDRSPSCSVPLCLWHLAPAFDTPLSSVIHRSLSSLYIPLINNTE